MAITKWDGPFKDMDPLTWQTVVQIQLQDCEEMAASSKGKGKQREGSQTDAQLAMQTYANDLKHSDHYLQDRKMAQSAAMAILADGDLVAETFKEEQQAVRDREMAMSLDGRRPPAGDGRQRGATAVAGPAFNVAQNPAKKQKKDHKDPWQDAEVLEKVTAMYMKAPEEAMPDAKDAGEVVEGESSAWAAARKTNTTRPTRTCIACSEEMDFFQVIRVPCNHEYCRSCLDSLFAASMKDESLFPPRCDNQEISLEWVRLWLSAGVAKEFEEKYEELNTKNRTYCHDPKCSTFIPESSYDGTVATCSRCRKTTCNNCKNPSHTGDCPEDDAMRQLIATADTQQWQRCYQRNAVVELEQGCYHMRCRCNAQFCYICGEKWKTCQCAQWDENRLLRRATQLVDRNSNRKLFRPERVPHKQPDTEPAVDSASPIPTTSAAWTQSSTNKRQWDSIIPGVHRTVISAADSIAETENEEWEPDWWLHDTIASEAGAGPGPVYERGAQIAHAVQHLRTNHGCAQHNWRHRRGEYDCESCGEFCNRFVRECRDCGMQACTRCTLNRL